MRRLASRGCFVTSSPSRTMRPPVGRTRVFRQPRVVLLPAPFGPSSPKNSPASTANEIPRTASTGGVRRRPGYVFTRFSTTSRLISLLGGPAVADDHPPVLHHAADRGPPPPDEGEEAGRAQQDEGPARPPLHIAPPPVPGQRERRRHGHPRPGPPPGEAHAAA